MTSRRIRRLAWAGTALLFALGGCGSEAAPPAVATAQSGAPTATPSPTTDAQAEYVDAQRAWVKCMREHGYNLPDPDAKGHVDLGAFMTERKLVKTDAGFVAAQQACASLLKSDPGASLPPVTAEQLANRRKYAKCMRANGLSDWPDPGPDGEWPNTGALGGSPAHPERFDRAIQVCDPVIDGRPPASFDPRKTPQG